MSFIGIDYEDDENKQDWNHGLNGSDCPRKENENFEIDQTSIVCCFDLRVFDWCKCKLSFA